VSPVLRLYGILLLYTACIGPTT